MMEGKVWYIMGDPETQSHDDVEERKKRGEPEGN
jgi:hypothetical protein